MKKHIMSMIATTVIILLTGCDDPISSGNNGENHTAITALSKMKLINSLGQTFQMGNNNGWDYEKPQHQVSFTYNFYMDSTEVTQNDFDSTMFLAYENYQSRDWSDTLGSVAGSNFPAGMINWYEAVLYCNARSKSEGRDTVYLYESIQGDLNGNISGLANLTIDFNKDGYRLPTEAEWEYACRAGTITDYYWEFNSIDNYAWYNGNSDDEMHQVALKQPNAFGLYDMSGNMKEWTNDSYADYTNAPQIDPTGANDGSARVLRGGGFYDSYDFTAQSLRSSFREVPSPDFGGKTYGFRVVLVQRQ